MSENKNIAIVIPIYKPILSKFEQISLDRCFKVLSKYNIYFVLPTNLNTNFYKNRYQNYKEIFFDNHYFENIEGYNKLMLSSSFYDKFSVYKYILIYQTDCYVFEDNLKFWINKNYDYIGGIWFKNYLLPKDEDDMWLAGNGGLSLRKVDTFKKVTKSKKYVESFFTVLSKLLNRTYPIRDVVKLFGIRNSVKWFVEKFKDNEDSLFVVELPKLLKSFTICPVDEALLFSYDRSPQFLYEYNNFTLPFGCHAWYREDDVYQGNSKFWFEILQLD